MPSDSLTVTDNRTGKTYELPIADGAIRAMDLRKIRTGPEDFGLLSYDPAFMNTASTISRITEIDGDRGILRYRGYPIEELAERSNYLEVAYLVLHGEPPTLAEMDQWVYDVTHHTWVHENLKTFMNGFHHDAHPMGMMVSAALSTFYPEAKDGADPAMRRLQIVSDLFRMLRRPELFTGRCGRCEYAQPCGGSRERAFAATGDPMAEDPLCLHEPADST